MTDPSTDRPPSHDDIQRYGSVAIDIAIRLVLLGLLIGWSLTIVAPFAAVVLWAVVLTVALYPVYDWLKRKLGSSAFATWLITIVSLLIILGPAVALLVNLVDTIGALAAGLQAGTLTAPPPPDSVREIPLVGESVYKLWLDASTNLTGFLTAHGDKVYAGAKTALSSIANLGGGVLMFIASVIISAFFYSPGPWMVEGTRVFATRLSGERGREFVDMAGATIRNVSRGVVGISAAQALLAGIIMVVAGVPGAGLIALVALVLGIIQVGPGIVLIPTLIWYWTSAETTSAVLFTLFMVPVIIGDNFVKPFVMAKGLSTPMLVILIGVIGGTFTHGLLGLFVGPIVLAVTYELFMAWVKAQTGEAEGGGAAK
ncbi:AI-2E family transporter [Rhodobacteraceae bacterium NNCM2]|nr:AI-2E family transporter [Coraliihabitans acroporae]